MMTALCKRDLCRVQTLIKGLSEADYTQPSPVIFGASIGQHCRHILEFYGALLTAENGLVCYDDRRRSIPIETSIPQALHYIAWIQESLTRLEGTSEITLRANFGEARSHEHLLSSSLERELAYCLDHSIHHQAMIKIALAHKGLDAAIPECFGIAPSTRRHQATTKLLKQQ